MLRLLHLSRYLLLLVGALGHLAAQQNGLYLITGTPNNKGGFLCHCDSELYKASPPGQPVLIRRLATHEGRGLHSVLPDYERGAVFVAAPGSDYPGLEVISMRNPIRVVSRPAVAKEIPSAAWQAWSQSAYATRTFPGPPSLLAMRLVGSGPEALVWLHFGDDRGTANTAYAWSEASGTLALRPTDASAITGLRIHGTFGFPGSGIGDSDTEIGRAHV